MSRLIDCYNIFEKDKIAVKNFCKFSRNSSPPTPYINYAKIAIEIFQQYFSNNRRINVLECGMGYGRFGIPLAKVGKTHNIFVYGFDSSPYMKEEFDQQLNFISYRLPNIKYHLWNPESWNGRNGFCPYRKKFFNAIQFFEFLYYLRDWRQGIDKLLHLLKEDGIIIIDQEQSSYMYSVNGKFDYCPSKIDLLVSNFWKKFYKERRKFTPHPFTKRDISPCHYKEVLNYLKTKGYSIKRIEDKNLIWDRTLSFQVFLNMIKFGFIPFITYGLKDNEKKDILTVMKSWLSRNHINPKEKFSVKCRLILYLCRKERSYNAKRRYF